VVLEPAATATFVTEGKFATNDEVHTRVTSYVVDREAAARHKQRSAHPAEARWAPYRRLPK
jgi:hypothetical protein